MRQLAPFALAALLVPLAATAAPPMPPGGPGMARKAGGPMMDRTQREKMLRKIHTMMVVELGDLLDLDTAGTIKLSDRLSKYSDQRIQLQLENWDAMEQLKRASQGEAGIDAAGLAKKLAANRVALAQLDQQELADVMSGLSGEKAAKVAVFLAQFPKRVEHMARMARGMGPGMGPGGMGGGGPMGHGWRGPDDD